MSEISPAAVEQLRRAGITDAEIDALRRAGSITTIGVDGQQTTVSIGEGGRVVMTTTTTTTSASGMASVDNTAAVHIAETALGQDLDGDGIIGRPAQAQRAAAGAATLAPSPSPFVDAGDTARPRVPVGALIAVVVGGVAVGIFGVLIWWAATQLAVIGNCGTSRIYVMNVPPCPERVVETLVGSIFGLIIFGLLVIGKSVRLRKSSRGLARIALVASLATGVGVGATIVWDALPERITKDTRDAGAQDAVDSANRQADAAREAARKQVEEALEKR